MEELIITEFGKHLSELEKLDRQLKNRIRRTTSDRNAMKNIPRRASMDYNGNEPSKEDFKNTCDSLLKQLKNERIKNDKLSDEIKALKAKIHTAEDNNKILLTTIDILNNKIEDFENFIYEFEFDDYDDEEYEEEDKKEVEEKNKPKIEDEKLKEKYIEKESK